MQKIEQGKPHTNITPVHAHHKTIRNNL